MNAETRSFLEPLELEIYQTWKGQFPKKIFLAVSGGLDSRVLLEVFSHLQERLETEVGLIHVHHGPSNDNGQIKYRDESRSLVENIAHEKSLQIFCSEPPEEALRSEEEFRRHRMDFFTEIRRREGGHCILLGHHQEDQLETQLMSLLRGAGEIGLQGMDEGSPKSSFFRPFLRYSREYLKTYALKKNLNWIEDPSNKDSKYFRNWLRNEWLIDLENHRPGSLKSLSRSMDHLSGLFARERDSFEQELFLDKDGILALRLPMYLALSSREQLRALALFLKKHQIHEFTRSQLVEVQKRLDSEQKSHSFKVGGHLWRVHSTEISLESSL
jgi:tRNA(Ile)-lysidine synthase